MVTEIIVKKGDCLSKYAKTYGVSVEDIAKANNLSNPGKIREGQKITIPIVKNETTETKTTGLDTVSITSPAENNVAKNENLSKKKEKNFLNTINRYLNISNYDTDIVELDGRKFLRISRPADDKYQPDKRQDMDLDSIKLNLRIKDGVINKYNDLEVVTRSRCWDDDNTIDPGQFLDVPVSELGQRKNFLGFETDECKNIKQAVLEFLN